MRKLKIKFIATMVFLVIVFGGGIPWGPGRLHAGDTCWDGYTRDTSTAWNALSVCISDTNNWSWYEKLGVRTMCNAKWFSDIFQAETKYAGCMSVENVLISGG